MSLKNLPEDILLEIVAKLPAKSFRRLSCVTKSLHTLLENPHSIEKHTDNLKNNEDELIYLSGCLDIRRHEFREMFEKFGACNIPSTVTEPRSVRIPQNHQLSHLELLENDESFMRVIGSCNGILCLQSKGDGYPSSRVYLYNPTTRKDITLPPSLFNGDVLGFGFDKLRKDYKVIRFRCSSKEKYAEIYKFSTRRWSKVDPPDFTLEDRYRHDGNHVFVNGFLCWLYRSDDNARILRFDVHSETFDVVELSIDPIWPNLSLAVLDDSLIVCSTSTIVSLEHRLVVDVWIMKEHGNNKFSWTKKFSVNDSTRFWSPMTISFMFHGTRLVLLYREDIFNVGAGNYRIASFSPEDDGEGGTRFTTRTLLLSYNEYCDMRGVIFQPSLVSLPVEGPYVDDDQW